MVKVVLNTQGVRELLRSKEMESICAEHARQTMNNLGPGYEMDTYTGENRVNAMIKAVSGTAKRDNLKNNTLLKALR